MTKWIFAILGMCWCINAAGRESWGECAIAAAVVWICSREEENA